MFSRVGSALRRVLFIGFVSLTYAILIAGAISYARPFTIVLKQDIPQGRFAGARFYKGYIYVELNWLTKSDISQTSESLPATRGKVPTTEGSLTTQQPRAIRRLRGSGISIRWMHYRARMHPTNCWGVDFEPNPQGTSFGERCMNLPLEPKQPAIRMQHNVQMAAYFVLPAAVSALYPIAYTLAYVLWRRRRKRRQRLGLCVHCAYDLRGSTSGRCPECGRPVSVEAESSINDVRPP